MQQELPLASMENLLKKAGAKRASEEAKKEMQAILKKKIEENTRKAQLISKNAGRKTIKKKDLLLSF